MDKDKEEFWKTLKYPTIRGCFNCKFYQLEYRFDGPNSICSQGYTNCKEYIGTPKKQGWYKDPTSHWEWDGTRDVG